MLKVTDCLAKNAFEVIEQHWVEVVPPGVEYLLFHFVNSAIAAQFYWKFIFPKKKTLEPRHEND